MTLADDTSKGLRRVTSIEGITEYRLENGLQVLLFPDESQSIVTVNMTVFVGSRHEGYGEAGMAHLLEHMLFKGTPSNENIPDDLKQRGASFNGTTWLDRTNYYETLPAADDEQAADNLEYAIRMEADRLVNSKILGEDLQSEMTVVRNEFERGENNPQRVLMQRVQAAAFEWHNYGRSTIGNQSDIERVPVNRLRDFYRKYYRPDNVMLVIAGKFDADSALQHVEKYFGILPQPQRPLDRTYTTEPAQDGERTVVLRRVGNTQLIQAAYHVPSGANREYAAIEMVASIMGAEPSGRLYTKLIEPELASSMFSFPLALHDPGLVMFGAQLPATESIESARQALISTVEGVAEEPVSEAELRRARNQFLKERQLRASNTTQLAIELSEWASQGDWRLYFLYRDNVESLTADECTDAAKHFLTRNNRTVGLFIPSETSERIEVPTKPNLSEMLADYKGRGEIQKGEAFDADPLAIEARTQRTVLSSGMKAVMLPKKTRGGGVNLRIAIRYGDESSLADLSHACDFLPMLMLRGTESLSYAELEDRQDELLCTIRPSGQAGLLVFNVETRREKLAEVMDLLREILRRPALEEEEFVLMQRQQIAAIESQQTEPGVLGRIALQRTMSPYASDDIRYVPTLEELVDRISSVSIEQIRALHGEQVSGQHGEITVVGDFEPADVLEQCERLVSGWTVEQPFQRVSSPAKINVDASYQQIETPDKSNAVYFAGESIEMRDDSPDYPALLAGNFVFGGGAMSSRLGQRIRQNEGLSYSVGSRFSAHPIDRRATLVIQAICNPSKRQQLMDAVDEELARLLEEGVTHEELEAAKQSLLQSEQVTRTQDASLVGILGNSAFAGRDLKFNAQQDQRLAELTVGQVNAALRKYFAPERMIVVTAGDFAAAAAAAPAP